MSQPIKLMSLFSGYGGEEFALKKANIPYEIVGYSEIDKNAIKCYEQNFPNIKNYGDCSKIIPEELPDFDLLTASFPCQDVSIAGKRDLSKGRTLLVNDIFRIVKVKKPKYIFLENVKGLLSFKGLWNSIRYTLKNLGYGVVYKVLNSKDYGIPQNRERIWIVCKYGGWDFMEFQFPEKQKLTLTLKDILEKDVDKKYYLSEEKIKKIIMKKEKMEEKGYGFGLDVTKEQEISPSICSRDYKDGGSIRVIGKLDVNGYDIAKRTYDEKGISPTINTTQIPKICKIIDNKGRLTLKDGDTSFTLTGSGRNSGKNQGIIFNEKTRDVDKAIEVAKQLSEKEDKPVQLDVYHLKSGEIRPLSTFIPQNLDEHRCIQAGQPKEILIYKNIIRRLTPKECFHLQGFLNDEIKLDGISDSQAYKLAGNGVDINLVSLIFKNMFKNER